LKSHPPQERGPAPDTHVSASFAGATAVDNAARALQAEADKTGDRSKVAAYMRDKRTRQAGGLKPAVRRTSRATGFAHRDGQLKATVRP
jgi:hypothetical protein